MQKQTSQKKHSITLIFANNMTRTVQVKASSRVVAERRALKRNPAAVGVKQGA